MAGEERRSRASTAASQIRTVRSKAAVTMRESSRRIGGRDSVSMAGKDIQLPARSRIPDSRGLVAGAGDDVLTVGRECGRSEDVARPASTASCLPVAASHTRAVLSSEAVTMLRPIG